MKTKNSVIHTLKSIMSAKGLLFAVITLLALVLWTPQALAIPKIIISMDLSSDHDDVADLAVLNALADLGECEILACVADAPNGATPLAMNSINTYFGRPNVPCAKMPNTNGLAEYVAYIANEFPHPKYATYQDCPNASDLMRQVLSTQPDHSVTIVTTGFMNSVQALMQSGPDQYSPLNGMDLIRQKVKLLSVAGGFYPFGSDFNFAVQPAASAYVLNNWPVAAMYVGTVSGNYIYSGGELQQTGTDNPIRRGFELTFFGPYPTWGQIAIYYAVREAESQSLWGYVTNGHNNGNPADGTNWWSTETDPSGAQEQSYMLDVVRNPVQEAIDALVMNSGSPKIKGSLTVPTMPTNIRATVASGSQINLQWTDNSWNETGFTIERKTNGVYTPIATVAANVTTYSHTGLTSTANVAYRIKANNSFGASKYTYKTVYSGWTEYNLSNPSDHTPIYNYYQYDNLNWITDGLGRNHVSVNNDSTHSQDLTINVKVASQAHSGNFYIYFFYQDANNWYRLNAGELSEGNVCKFEKSINGTITQIGASGTGVTVGEVTKLQDWKVIVSPSGNMQFLYNGNETYFPDATIHQVLNVTESLKFSSGKIGLGSNYNAPVWDQFSFDTASGAAPVISSASSAYGIVGKVFSNYHITGTNIPASYTATGLPPGLSVSTGTGIISGNPTTAGTYNVTIGATNSSGSGSSTLTLTVLPAGSDVPSITSPTAASIMAGSVFNYTITAANNPTSFSATGLPAGLSLNTSTGAITGIPLSSGTNTVTLNAYNLYNTGTATLTLTVTSNGAAIVNGSFENPTVADFSYDPSGSGWTFTNKAGIEHNSAAYSAPFAPQGTQAALLQAEGSTNGTMSQVVDFASTGTFRVSFQAAFRRGYDGVNPFNVKIDGNVVGSFTPTSSAAFISYTTPPFTVSTTGNHTLQFIGTGSGARVTFIDSIVMSQGTASTPSITSAATASGTVGSAFSYNITANNGPTTFGASGLPAGLSVNATTGAITGTPTAAATSSVIVSATNASGTGTATLTLTINAGGGSAPVVTSAATATGTVGNAFSYSITATNSPTSYGASGLPAGLSVNTGTGAITGTPTSAATSTVTLSATNANGSGTRTLTLTVSSGGGSAPVINSMTTASGTAGSAFSYNITASNSPTAYGATGLPSGLSVNTSTGAITGIPATAATSTVTLSATNATGTGTAALTLTVNPVGGGAPTVMNPSFETPAVPNFDYAPSGSGWAFTNYAGIQQNGGTYSYSGPSTTAGLQTGFVQYYSGTNGTMSQAINFPSTGSYTISFTSAYRPGASGANPFVVKIDGNTVGTFTPTSSTSLTSYTTQPFTIPSTGSHTLQFAGTGTSGDRTSFIDSVVLTSSGGGGSAPVISSATTASGTVGTAFSYTITASNSPTSYSASGLPAGLSVNSTTGAITGTPTAVATSIVTLGATNASGTGMATLTLTVGAGSGGGPTVANPGFENPNVPDFNYSPSGSNWTFTNYAGIERNGGSYSYSGPSTTNGAQAGFVQYYNGTNGTMSQTINFPAAGSYQVSFNSAYRPGADGAEPFNVTIDGVVKGSFTPASSTGFMSYTTTPFTISSAGNHTLQFVGTGASGDRTSFIDSVVLSSSGGGGSAPVITSATTASTTVGSAFSYNITATNTPTSYAASGLPSGLSVNTGTGAITGTPTAAATSTVTLSAINASGTGTATLTLTVNAVGGGVSVANPSFETPSVADFNYTPSGSGWTFTNYAGVQHNGGTYSYAGPATSNGVQTGFVQYYNGTNGTMTQTINVATPGAYLVKFNSAYRPGASGAESFNVTLNGQSVGSFTPASSSAFTPYTSAPFTISTSGNVILQFIGTGTTGDRTSFIDAISIVPE